MEYNRSLENHLHRSLNSLKMVGASIQFFLLGLGVCLMAWHTHSVEVNGYGGDQESPSKLVKERAYMERLERLLEKATDEDQKYRLQKVTNGVKAIIEKTQALEEANKKLQKELELSEEQHAHMVKDLKAENEKYCQQIKAYQAKLDELTKLLEMTMKGDLALKTSTSQQQKSSKYFNDPLKKGTKILMTQSREELPLKDSQAEPSTSQKTATPVVSFPYKDEIKKYDTLLAESIITSNYYEKVSKLNNVKKCLRVLYEKLYEEGKFTRKMSIQELDHTLDFLDMYYVLSDKENQENKKGSVHDKMKNKKSTGQDEEKDAAHQNSQNKVGSFETFENVARRWAYIDALRQVMALQDECNYALKNASPEEDIYPLNLPGII